jgi:hypothetical protein
MAMASENVRWRNVREFLDDLPGEHCHVKPDHDFCTVCMRINYRVAQDCPLYHLRPKRKLSPTPPPPEARPDPIKDHLSADDVKQALRGEDFPIIEFAGPRGTGGHDEDEEIFEVKPIDVKPVPSPPPEAIKKPPKKEEPPKEETEAADARPATAVADRDPESIVQEIMEELEFPEGEEEPVEDKEEPAEEEEEPAEEKGEPAEDEEEPVEDEEETKGPPVVKKEAVKKRRPKSK